MELFVDTGCLRLRFEKGGDFKGIKPVKGVCTFNVYIQCVHSML